MCKRNKEEDPRDYRVKYDKIREKLGFRISKRVQERIKDILTCLRLGIIEKPDDQKYYKIPLPNGPKL
jgi:hypothetical protein